MFEMPLLANSLVKTTDRIAFFGPMCSGKTYLANYLVENYGYTKVGFADKLKATASDLFGIDPSNKDGDVRVLLQQFADDIKRWDADIFIKHFLRNCISKGGDFAPIVCDDLRFGSEARVLRDNGFTLILVDTDPYTRAERIVRLYPNTDPNTHQHKSEQEYKSIFPDLTMTSDKPKDADRLSEVLYKDRILKYGARG